jgi:hypothetical protein
VNKENQKGARLIDVEELDRLLDENNQLILPFQKQALKLHLKNKASTSTPNQIINNQQPQSNQKWVGIIGVEIMVLNKVTSSPPQLDVKSNFSI